MLNKLLNHRTPPLTSDPRDGMTEIQAAVYDAILITIDNGGKLPAEASAFMPIIKMKLGEGIKNTADSTILETFDTFLSRAELLFDTLHELPTGEPWKPRA